MTEPDRVPIPDDTLAIFPRNINLIYEQTPDGTPIIGILYTHHDELMGSYVMWLSRDAAEYVASNITGILTNPDTFKAEWLKQNGHTHD